MGRRDRQRIKNRAVRESIPGGGALLDLKDKVQKWSSRETNSDVAEIYADLCDIAETMRGSVGRQAEREDPR